MSKETNIKKLWEDSPAVVKLAIYGAGAFVLYTVGRKLWDDYQIRKRVKLYQQQNVQFNVQQPGLPPAAQQINLASVATEIHDSLYNSDWFGWFEDEERAIAAVKTVPKAYIPNLEAVYLQLFGKDLRADLLSYLSGDEWSQISYLF
jgi:hypothetical protein